MIVDCHTHVWPSRDQLGQAEGFSCLAGTDLSQAGPELHQDSCDPAGVTLVLGFVSDYLHAEVANTYIHQYVASRADRTLGLAGIDPTRKDCQDQLRQLHEEQGFVGLTLSPACQGFHPCDTRAMRVYELAEQLDLPIYFLQGMTLPPSATVA